MRSSTRYVPFVRTCPPSHPFPVSMILTGQRLAPRRECVADTMGYDWKRRIRRCYLFDHSCPVLEFSSPPKLASFLPHSTWRCLVPCAVWKILITQDPSCSTRRPTASSAHDLAAPGARELAGHSARPLGAGWRRQRNKTDLERCEKSPATRIDEMCGWRQCQQTAARTWHPASPTRGPSEL